MYIILLTDGQLLSDTMSSHGVNWPEGLEPVEPFQFGAGALSTHNPPAANMNEMAQQIRRRLGEPVMYQLVSNMYLCQNLQGAEFMQKALARKNPGKFVYMTEVSQVARTIPGDTEFCKVTADGDFIPC